MRAWRPNVVLEAALDIGRRDVARECGSRDRRSNARNRRSVHERPSAGRHPARRSASPPAPRLAQQPAMDDLRMIRYKISAGDLPSAESILEVHRAEKGEDGEYLLGLAWVARGAALMGDWKAASRYAKSARELALAKLGTPRGLRRQLGGDLRARHRDRGRGAGAGRGRKEEGGDAIPRGEREGAGEGALQPARPDLEAPQPDRARGQKAPGFRAEDHLGARTPRRSSPCAESRSCSFSGGNPAATARCRRPALRRTVEKYAARRASPSSRRRASTRRTAPRRRRRSRRRGRRSTTFPTSVAVPISDEAMLRYGVSATPTFVFIDRKGVVAAVSAVPADRRAPVGRDRRAAPIGFAPPEVP